MNSIKVNLSMLRDSPRFVNAASNVSNPIVLKSGKYVVDAESILGIYSLNLMEPVIVESENGELDPEFIEQISNLIV